MAYEIRQRPEEDEEKQAGPEGDEGGFRAAVPGLVGAPPTSALAAPGVSPANPSPEQVGRFVNFDRILSANKDIGQREADALTGRLQKAGQDTEAGLKAQQGQFADKMAAGTPEWARNFKLTGKADVLREGSGAPAVAPAPINYQSTQQGMTGTPQKGPGSTFQGQGVAGAAQKDMPATLGQAQDWRKAEYAGPKGLYELEGWGKFANDAVKAQDLLALTGQPGGIRALAAQTAPDAAGAKLDASLLQALGQGEFDKQRERFAGLDKSIKDAIGASQKEGIAAADDVKKAASAYGKSADGVQGAIDTDNAGKAQVAARQAEIDKLSQPYMQGPKPEWGQMDPLNQGAPAKFHAYVAPFAKESSFNSPVEEIYRAMSPAEVAEFMLIDKDMHPDLAAHPAYAADPGLAKQQLVDAFYKRMLEKYGKKGSS